MTDARVTIDISPLYVAAANILNRAGADWLQASQKETPVRQPDRRAAEPGARSEQFPVRLGGTKGLSPSLARLRTQVIGEGKNIAFRRAVQRGGSAANRQVASLFRITQGPHKGKAPDFLVERGKRLVGVVSKVQGGGLRAATELLPATREGSRVTIVLQNKLRYAAPVEYGFHHKGGGNIKAKRFMRGPRDSMILPALREGKYVRG